MDGARGTPGLGPSPIGRDHANPASRLARPATDKLPRTPTLRNSSFCIEMGFLSTFGASDAPSEGARASMRAADESYLSLLLHEIATGRNPDRIISHWDAYSAGMQTSENSPLLPGPAAAIRCATVSLAWCRRSSGPSCERSSPGFSVISSKKPHPSPTAPRASPPRPRTENTHSSGTFVLCAWIARGATIRLSVIAGTTTSTPPPEER
jgi:hypothetical protein